MLGPRANSIRRRYRHRSLNPMTYMQRQVLEDWQPVSTPPLLEDVVRRRIIPVRVADGVALEEAMDYPLPDDGGVDPDLYVDATTNQTVQAVD